MKKLFSIFIIILTYINCINGQEIQKTALTSDYNSIVLLGSTDGYSYDTKNDTSILKYKDFIVSIRIIEVSQDIRIFSEAKQANVFYNSNYYFKGLINNRFAIFDEGTTNIRGLMIYDLVKDCEVLNISYQDNLLISNNAIAYKTEVYLEPRLRPKCPEEIEQMPFKIYLEKQLFDFETLKIIKTGKYICSFME